MVVAMGASKMDRTEKYEDACGGVIHNLLFYIQPKSIFDTMKFCPETDLLNMSVLAKLFNLCILKFRGQFY